MSETAESTAGRTTWDVVLGAVVVVIGLVVLGHTFLATAFSLFLVGWLLVAAGILALVVSVLHVGRPGFLMAALGGALMVVLGLVFLRNTGAAAVTVTLVAGSVFLSTGIARLVAAAQAPDNRAPLLLSGVVATVLGGIVLLNVVAASGTLLGVILGVQLLSEGVAIALLGRRAVVAVRLDDPAPETRPSR